MSEPDTVDPLDQLQQAIAKIALQLTKKPLESYNSSTVQIYAEAARNLAEAHAWLLSPAQPH